MLFISSNRSVEETEREFCSIASSMENLYNKIKSIDLKSKGFHPRTLFAELSQTVDTIVNLHLKCILQDIFVTYPLIHDEKIYNFEYKVKKNWTVVFSPYFSLRKMSGSLSYFIHHTAMNIFGILFLRLAQNLCSYGK